MAFASDMPKKPISFADIKRIEQNLHYLDAESKIMDIRIKSLEKSFSELKAEFDALSDLCAKTIIKDK